jgi:FtsH-binding integral membrane protein
MFRQQTVDPAVIDMRREFVESGDANSYLRQVFTTMTLGLFITAAAGWFVASSPALMSFFFGGFMRYVTLFAPLVVVMVFASRIHKMSFTTASLVFAGYSASVGISLAYIFLMFSLGTLAKVFSITAGTFGAMALFGWVTKIDLTKYRSIFMMALVGLIIALVVNMFVGSPAMDYYLSIGGVLIFSALTAYDIQKILTVGAVYNAQGGIESEGSKKMALMGALNLYLDFVNLFLFLLRIFGGRD